jgi:UDP-N-acetylmuramoyl-tripeptide--D-alanyl-D-alanine ligase
MAFLSIYQFDEEDSRQYAQRAVKMALWKIDDLPRRPTHNASYAYEGLISAWELARQSGDQESQEKIGRQIREGMLLPMTWQVGGPMPNKYLREHSPPAAIAIGGAMNGPENPELRIDVTQHQMHAVILARRYVYPE